MFRATERAVRLVKMRDLLLSGSWTVDALAHTLDVHPNTVKRDLVSLQLPPLSVPLQVDDEGHWYVTRL